MGGRTLLTEATTATHTPIRAPFSRRQAARVGLLTALATIPAAIVFSELAAPPAPPAPGAPGALWWLSRASGLFAYLALIAGMLLGLLLSTRVHTPLIGKRKLLELHELSLVAVIVPSAVHILAVSGHEAFAAGEPSIVARAPGILGLAAFLGLGLLALSRWLRGQLSQQAFRRLHMLAYAVCAAGVGHAALAGGLGVDERMRVLYIAGGGVVAALTLARITPLLLRAIGLRGRALPRARWRLALRGKRRPAAQDGRRQRPAA